MGIQGLIGVMTCASRNANINEMNGSIAVIDAYGWIHRACYGCAQHIYTGEDTLQYVNYCLNRAQMLIRSGVKPILVFDGQKLPAKELTNTNRQIIKHNVRQKINLLLSEGNESKAKELMKSCVEVTHNMAKKVINALRDHNIDYIVSPFEADAQMAYLVNNGFADFVITEDSDLLVFNCRLCFFKMDSNGNGKLVDLSLLKQCLGNNFNSDKLRHMSILSGCDYLPNLPGIGIQKAKKFFKMTVNNDLKKLLFKVPNYLKMTKRVKITQEYVDNFIKADNTFKYQLVFCPINRKLVPLLPYEKDINIEELSYAGNYFSDELGEDFAYQYAIGNVDINTLKIVDTYDCVHKSNSIWSKDRINYKNKCHSNKILAQKSSPIVSADNKCNEKSKTCENDMKNSPRKRLKVSENSFVTNKELLKEYSMNSNKNNKPIDTLNKQQIYSRNIFKVANHSPEDSTQIQSKYFSDLGKNSIKELIYEEKTVNKTEAIHTKFITQSSTNSINCSQYSLNSSGNSVINSTFGETSIMSDTERSEISETTDEEIDVIFMTKVKDDNKYTNIKSKNNNAFKRRKPLNINSNKNKDIRNYFK